MKKNIFTKTLAVATTALAVGGVFFAISAKAEENYVHYVQEYYCTNESFYKLAIYHDPNAVDNKAFVNLQTNPRGGESVYSAVYEKTNGGISTKNYVYKLFKDNVEVGTLKVTTQQNFGRGGGFCGRAGCDFPKPVVPVYTTYAALKLGEYEDSFVCNQ